MDWDALWRGLRLNCVSAHPIWLLQLQWNQAGHTSAHLDVSHECLHQGWVLVRFLIFVRPMSAPSSIPRHNSTNGCLEGWPYNLLISNVVQAFPEPEFDASSFGTFQYRVRFADARCHAIGQTRLDSEKKRIEAFEMDQPLWIISPDLSKTFDVWIRNQFGKQWVGHGVAPQLVWILQVTWGQGCAQNASTLHSFL